MKKYIKMNEKDLTKIIKSKINEVTNTSVNSNKLPCECPPGYTLITGCWCVRKPDPVPTTK